MGGEANNGLPARVAAAIYGARRRKGLSQARLANEVGVGEDTIGDWERGAIPESWLNLLTLARLLMSGDSEFSLDRLALGDQSFFERVVTRAGQQMRSLLPELVAEELRRQTSARE